MNNDELKNWIELNCRASQQKQELADLLEEVQKINPKWILDVGMHRGFSVEIWDKIFKPEFIIGIEPEMHKVEYFPKTPHDYIKGLSTDEATIQRLIVDISGEVKLDFVFIDGDHTYKTARADFERFKPFVKVGGIIAFHDISLDEPKWVEAGVEVCKLWREIVAKFPGQTKAIHYEGGTGTGIFFVK